MAVARSLLFAVIVAALPRSLAAPADSGRLVPGPAWEYHFPPGLLDTANFAVTPDYRYLAIVSGRWTYHPKGEPEQATSEGENAVYVFDLSQKQLLWKQALPEGQVPIVRGISPAAEFTAVEVNPCWRGETRRWERDGQQMEGRQLVGPPEPGVRLYDRRGTLVAAKAPLQRPGSRRLCDVLVLRPLAKGEEPVSGELRHRLTAAGIREVDVLPPPDPITKGSRDGVACIVGLDSDGTTKWEWPVPADETLESSALWPLALSPDGNCALAGYLLVTPEGSPTTRRFHFFTLADGWRWSRDLPRAMPWTISWEVSNGGRSALIKRDQGERTTVDVLGPDGQTKTQHTFYIFGIWPSIDLSPNGRYWAAMISRVRDEATAYAARRGMAGSHIPPPPRVDESAWTEGLHVFSCDTGNVAWRATLPSRSWWKLIALDSGGVIAISETLHTLAVFDPPTSTAK
jgi:hypothetical protein